MARKQDRKPGEKIRKYVKKTPEHKKAESDLKKLNKKLKDLKKEFNEKEIQYKDKIEELEAKFNFSHKEITLLDIELVEKAVSTGFWRSKYLADLIGRSRNTFREWFKTGVALISNFENKPYNKLDETQKKLVLFVLTFFRAKADYGMKNFKNMEELAKKDFRAAKWGIDQAFYEYKLDEKHEDPFITLGFPLLGGTTSTVTQVDVKEGEEKPDEEIKDSEDHEKKEAEEYEHPEEAEKRKKQESRIVQQVTIEIHNLMSQRFHDSDEED